MVSPDDRRYNPAYEGAIWVDKDTRRVLRIEQRTSSMPRDWPFKGAECILEYGFVKIDQKTYLLPATAEPVASHIQELFPRLKSYDVDFAARTVAYYGLQW